MSNFIQIFVSGNIHFCQLILAFENTVFTTEIDSDVVNYFKIVHTMCSAFKIDKIFASAFDCNSIDFHVADITNVI